VRLTESLGDQTLDESRSSQLQFCAVASIIIPAHNEEAVIGVTLSTLLRNLNSKDIEVFVVCNGCSDETAAVAGEFGDAVHVIKIERASKTAALNAGDSVASSYPRIYLDADIEIEGSSIARLLDVLERPGTIAAEPALNIDMSASTLPVRAYYAVWVALHGREPGDVGGGLYAMTREGRLRFGDFPDVIADDAYAKAHLDSDELVRVHDSLAVVYAPERVADLLRIKTRSRLGIMELREKYPKLWGRKRANTKSLAEKAAALPLTVWPSVPTYVVLQLVAKRRAKRLNADLGAYRWQRDESSRHRRS
jgi:glycosyltransferase involved in cell wall biosynthesis